MSSSSAIAPARPPVLGVRNMTNTTIDRFEEEVKKAELTQNISTELAKDIKDLSGEIATEYGKKVLEKTATKSNYEKGSQQIDKLLGLLIRVTNILTTKVDAYLSLHPTATTEHNSPRKRSTYRRSRSTRKTRKH
jgi:hypothetical protein